MNAEFDEIQEPAPPTAPGPLGVQAKPPVWPTVIGVLGILLSALIFLGGLCGILMSTPAEFLPLGVDTEDPGVKAAQTAKTVWSYASFAIWVPIGVLLLVASIGLLRRKQKAARIMRIWAVIDIVATLIDMAIAFSLELALQEAARVAMADPGQMPGARIEQVGLVAVYAIGMVIALAPAIFILIWFGLDEIKLETAEWP